MSKSYKGEIADLLGKWIENPLRFATHLEAYNYVFNLGIRRLHHPDGISDYRVVESSDEVNTHW